MGRLPHLGGWQVCPRDGALQGELGRPGPSSVEIWCLWCVAYLLATLYFEIIIHSEIAKTNKQIKNKECSKTPTHSSSSFPHNDIYQDIDIGAILC